MRAKPTILVLALLMASPANPATLQEQAICAAQAELSFKKDGYKKDDPADWANFTSHYDAFNQICFIGIEENKQIGKTSWTYRFVSDAIGGQSYAVYSWHTVEGKKYWEFSPFHCDVTTLAGEKIHCKDDEEFDELTRKNFGIFFK